ncbi:MAG: type 11 methyltransferase [Rhodospirillaceae bacterium]|nr:MAG: type 11 methyltransferase [Rhodospirillaceae bacterium]
MLDIGCGQGLALGLFRDAGHDVVGLTLGADAAVCRSKGLPVLETDFAFLDFPNATFDLVWCRHALEHSAFPLFTLAEIHRVLRPQGLVYVEVPAPDTACHHERNPNHYSVLSKDMWLSLFGKAGFDVLAAFDVNLSVPAGPDVYFSFLLASGAATKP